MSNPVTRTRQGLTRRTIITNAQILGLPTSLTGIELVPPQGDGTLIIVDRFISVLNWVANVTNIDATAQLYTAVGNWTPIQIVAQPVNTGVSQLLAGGQSRLCVNGAFNQERSDVVTGYGMLNSFGQNFGPAILNKPLILLGENGAAGNFTGGNAGNTLVINVFYNVIKVN